MNSAAGQAEISDDGFTVMVTAAGRRVELINLIQRSLLDLGVNGHVLATDIHFNAPAMHTVNLARTVPPYRDPGCLDAMLQLCAESSVRLIFPTFDPDLPFLARHRGQFEAIGTRVMVCAPQTVEIAYDKRLCHAWMVQHAFPVQRQADAAPVISGDERWGFPLFAKPRTGSASNGAMVVKSMEELKLLARERDYIVQEIARGREYTVDVYVDAGGTCRCAVPRLRIETRAGEVSKAMTVRCEAIESLAARVAEALPGAVGIMNIQMFHDARSGELVVSEINPRLGGGYPLSHEAGAPMVQWAIEECLGRKPRIDPSAWRDGLVMLRYDEAVFVSAQSAGLEPRRTE